MFSGIAALAVLRGLHLAAMLSLLGTVGFLVWILPAASIVPSLLHLRLKRLWWGSGLIALLTGASWFTLQAAVIAGATSLSEVLGAFPLVARHTQFGVTMMVRLVMLAVATALVITERRFPRYLAIAVVGIAVDLQSLIGHAGATMGASGDELVVSESLHLVAAGIWLGALLPLWLSLWVLAPKQAALICERFSPIGLACVLVLAGTGFAQGLELIGSVPGLMGTPYGRIALLKLTLFLIAVAIAALNRLWLTDRLAADASRAKRHLSTSVCIEIGVGLGIVVAAAFMASSVPAVHSTPVWPFSWQFSMTALDEDPDLRQSVVVSLVVIGGAAVLMAVALLRRRLRLAALALLILAIVVRGPLLSVLTVEAYPTSFQISPTDFSATSIARGRTVFAQNCVGCHGPEGEGDGPVAAGLHIKPADLTMPHIWEHSDGEMFWWLTHGIDDPEGGLAMPGFATVLSADDRWALIDYIRAHNAGFALQHKAAFDVPVRAPAFPVTCSGVTAANTADLLGFVVHVLTDAGIPEVIPPQAGASTIDLALRDTTSPARGSCVAANRAAWQAYAVLANLPPDNLAGTDFLVDPNGWLRAVHRRGAANGWQDKDTLIAAIHDIRSSPIHQPDRGLHEHNH